MTKPTRHFGQLTEFSEDLISAIHGLAGVSGNRREVEGPAENGEQALGVAFSRQLISPLDRLYEDPFAGRNSTLPATAPERPD